MKKRLIILVDDDGKQRRPIQLILNSVPEFVVRAFSSPNECLGKLGSLPLRPSLFILDEVMPDMTGGELADKLRYEYGHRNTPIFIYSALVMTGTVDESDMGKDKHVFLKGMSKDEMVQRIRSALIEAEKSEAK